MPVYALGGVTPARLPAVQELGFAGVGVLGAVWEADDPVAAMQAFASCLV
jgi:thiamine-phosphate pyrophosphorylase